MKQPLKERVDTTLSGLSWQAADSQRTLLMMKGEPKEKRRLTFGMAMAIALVIATMAFAVAEIIRYSVQEYQKLEGPEAIQHITAIGQEMKTGDVRIHLTDAVFNGRELYVVFEVEPLSGNTVYLVPFLEARIGGQLLQPHVFGSRGFDFDRGFWVPEKRDSGTDGRYGFDMRLTDIAIQDVDWELRFVELKPLWPTVDDTSGYSDDSDDAIDHELWAQQFADAFQNQQIMLVHGTSIMMFEDLLPEGQDLPQRLVASGAFEQTAQLKASWTSPHVQPKVVVANQLIQADGLEIQVDIIELSFMSLRYEFTVRSRENGERLFLKEGKRQIDYIVSSEDAQLRYLASSAVRTRKPDGQEVLVFTGLVNFSGEPPARLLFMPYVYDDTGQQIHLDQGVFSINLE